MFFCFLAEVNFFTSSWGASPSQHWLLHRSFETRSDIESQDLLVRAVLVLVLSHTWHRSLWRWLARKSKTLCWSLMWGMYRTTIDVHRSVFGVRGKPRRTTSRSRSRLNGKRGLRFHVSRHDPARQGMLTLSWPHKLADTCPTKDALVKRTEACCGTQCLL